jgi:hypothetical protein
MLQSSDSAKFPKRLAAFANRSYFDSFFVLPP